MKDLIEDYRSRYHIPAVSIAVARHGTLTHAEGYGIADLEHQVRATAIPFISSHPLVSNSQRRS